MNQIIPLPVAESNDLQALFSEGISIWGTSQEVLEEQALKELEIFVEQNQENKLHEKKNELNDRCEVQNADVNSKQLDSGVSLVTNQVSQSEIRNSGQELNIKQSRSKRISKYSLEEYVDDSESEYIPSEDEVSDEEYKPEREISSKAECSKKTTKRTINRNTQNSKVKDDALECQYKARLNSYYEKIEEEFNTNNFNVGDAQERDYKKIKGGLKVPKDLWEKLYDYQKEGIKWLWELHQKPTGGLLGDEMGLGKTVQIITFLHSVRYSQIHSRHCNFIGVGPTLIVCPATVIYQWVKHFHQWSPEFRIAILHQSGTHQGNKAKLIDEINKNKGIIITTYAGILKYKGTLCEYNWHYFILDEGHKIRNPTAKATIAIKHIRTPHRILLTGSPMQNNLTELWSLFDFTNPGMLGSLATFTEHFANPILQGGFTNASSMQEATALSVASTLKNIISPFLLRRMKNEVQNDIQLPHKSEQVLFCSLSDEQRDLYKNYLMSEQVNNILGRGIKTWGSDNFLKANMLIAITALRKICNHPDLFLNQEIQLEDDISLEKEYGYQKRSGKMVVVSALLKIWKKQGHRTLLFSQGRLMIKIFEFFLVQQGYKYLKMDGSTNINSRQALIDKFNHDDSYSVFLLTTRVGGLGVNLTGANRVIIYDPDWNPATDSQARERAWRIGQEKSVTVYRLISAGTVEEKMYQRQIWKQLLSNKVLIDPTTNKFFKSSDLFDLFSLPESPQANPETTNIFRDSRVKIQEKLKEKKSKKSSTITSNSSEKTHFSEDKIEEMKSLAKQIAKSLSQEGANSKIKTETKKTLHQLELEEQRQKKLKEKEKLKTLTPQELIEYNRWKAMRINNDTTNKIDDEETNVSFDKALERSSNTANFYRSLNEIKSNRIKKENASESLNKEVSSNSGSDKEGKAKKRKHERSSVDTSKKIDGEEVEGLIKRERKKFKQVKPANDNYILEHLFSKKGVSGVLEHESVLNGGRKQQSLKVRTYADERASKSLEALKKSRLNNWRW